MYIKVTKQDGKLVNATNATLNWTNFQSPQQNDTIYRIDSDIEQVNNQIYAATSESRSLTWKALYYDSSTQTWVEKYPYDVTYDNLIGLNIIRISGVKTYICTDAEIEHIPNYLTKPSIRYRINESITASNVTAFKHYKEIGSAHVAVALVCPFTGYASSLGMQFFTANAADNKVKLGFFDIQIDGSKNFKVESGSKNIAVSMELNDQGFIDADLASRVKQLEYEVALIKEKMQVYDKVIKDIPAITAALQENTTKFYVAR